mgnify:FL=1
MDERQRLQIGLIVAQQSRQLRGALITRMDALKSDHAARGVLQSGMTIKAAAQIVSAAIERLSGALLAEAGRICRDLEAFDLVSDAVRKAIDIGEEVFWPVVKLATGKPESAIDPSVERAAGELIANLKDDMEARLGIARFDFDEPISRGPSVEVAQDHPQPSTSKGGRPPAEFWDDLWSAMAIDLYTGALVPKSQADIERAMNDWLSAKNLSCANSTVRKRARKLWDGLREAN